jgi:hypothetical protein
MKQCTCCGENLPLTEFYKSQSSMFKYDQKCPICKKCMLSIYDENLQIYKSEEKALYKTLFSLDYYFDIKLCKRALIDTYNTDKDLLKTYMSSINLVQYRGKTSKDSLPMPELWDIPEDEFESYEIEDVGIKKPILITKEMITRWGEGRSNDDYLYLEDMYSTMIKTYDTSNPMSVETYKQIVLNYLDVKKLREMKNPDNKKIGEILKINSMLQADCRIKDVQASNDEDNLYWSKFIDEIEWTEPIPKPEKEFADVDGIKKYIKKWFVEPFAKSRKLKENHNTNERGDE